MASIWCKLQSPFLCFATKRLGSQISFFKHQLSLQNLNDLSIQHNFLFESLSSSLFRCGWSWIVRRLTQYNMTQIRFNKKTLHTLLTHQASPFGLHQVLDLDQNWGDKMDPFPYNDNIGMVNCSIGIYGHLGGDITLFQHQTRQTCIQHIPEIWTKPRYKHISVNSKDMPDNNILI